MQQFTGEFPFVAHDRFDGIERFEARQSDPRQMAADRRQAVSRFGRDVPPQRALASQRLQLLPVFRRAA